MTQEIEKFAQKKNLTLLGRVPFDPIFTKSMVLGQTVFEYNTDSEAGEAVKEIWRKLSEKIGF